jgi:autoinducer 2-degrading protein
MHILQVHIKVKPESIDDFIEATIANATSSLQEAGCVRFDLIQETAEPSHFELVEVYRDEASHAAHRETPHYSVWAEGVAGMFAEPRSRTLYRNVYPHDDAF